MGYEHGIIKVREWIPHIACISLLPKVIPSKLFSNMVHISSGDVTPALDAWTALQLLCRPQLSETKWWEMGRKVILCFSFPEIFFARSPVFSFGSLLFQLLFAHLAAHSFTVHSVLRSLEIGPQQQRQRAQWLCRHDFFNVFVHFSANLHRTTTRNEHILRMLENVKYDGHF